MKREREEGGEGEREKGREDDHYLAGRLVRRRDNLDELSPSLPLASLTGTTFDASFRRKIHRR